MPQRVFVFAFLLLLCACRATAGDTLRLYFPTNVSDLQPRAVKSLDSALYYNALSPDSALEILGYTDFVGSEAFNDSLSLRRAETVKGYLIQNGFQDRKVLRTIAKGELPAGMKMPANGIAAHRRVDIILNGKSANERLLELDWKPAKPTAKSKQKPQPEPVSKPEPKPAPVVAKNSILLPKEKPRSTATERLTEVIAQTPVGGSFQLSKLFFPSGSHVMYPTSEAEMRELLAVLQETATLRIRVEGHVCCIDTNMAKDALDEGTNEYRLSDNRARFVAQFLVMNGIKEERVSFVGFGKRFPIVAHEKTAEEAAANRRVEIRVLEK